MEGLLEFMGSTYQGELGEAPLNFKVYIIQVEFREMNQPWYRASNVPPFK